MLFFLSAVGLYFTFKLRGLQFTSLRKAALLTYRYRTGSGEGNISPLQSLFSALGGLIGNGNLGGVATAIAIGGPGAIFWFWVSALIAMIIVYVETKLALLNRQKDVGGTFSGGPMYYIEKLLHMRWLAISFALIMGWKSVMATATIQSNSIALAFSTTFGLPMFPACVVVAFLTWLAVIGGIQSIARTLEKVTPLMVLLYMVMGSAILFLNLETALSGIEMIVVNAFTPAGAAGGFTGATVMMALRYGVARGFYSNEAGTGSSPIMYSTARSDSPESLSLIAMFGVIIDTLVGTLTALVILSTGSWLSGETSTALTTHAFSTLLGNYGGYFIFLTSLLFGYSTLVAWSFYGEQCFSYVFGPRIRRAYRWIFCGAILFGFLEVEFLWSLGDLMNALTIITNIVALVLLVRIGMKGRE